MSQHRFLGHLVGAIRIDCFQEPAVFKHRLLALMQELRREPPLDPRVPVQVPGDPEKTATRERLEKGIPLSPAVYEALSALRVECGVTTELRERVAA